MIDTNARLQKAMRSLVSTKYMGLLFEVFIVEMYLRWYFIFTQLKATLRAGWKGVGVGGQRAEDGEAEVILLRRCLEKLGPARAGGRGRQRGCGLEGSWACVCKLYLILGLHPVSSLGLFLLNCVSCPRDKLAPERCLRGALVQC